MPLNSAHSFVEAVTALGSGTGPVVVVPVYNSPDDVRACIESLLAHTPTATPIVVIDDASPDNTAVDSVREVGARGEHRVVLYLREVNVGFVHSCNEAFKIAAGRDVVLVNSDVVVGPEWLERMIGAARSSNTVATVSTLTNHGTILSLPVRNAPGPMPEGLTVADAARRIAAAATQTRPVIPTAVGHCMYISRTALDVLGGFDPIFSPGYGEEVDFSQRAAAHGLLNVLADDVFVFHRGSASFGTSPQKQLMQDAHEKLINERHPLYAPLMQHASTVTRTSFANALSRARRALTGISVVVDGFCLGPQMMGTQRFVLETACALAEDPSVQRVDLVTPLKVPAYVRAAVQGRPRLHVCPQVPYKTYDQHYEVALRPYQVDHPVQLRWMRQVADVTVVTQLDMIAYHNAAYYGINDVWRQYRDITATAFEVVDGVAFISTHSREEAVREGLLSPQHHSAVTYCGIDHCSATVEPHPPPGKALRPGFLLVLGASYLHKNRMFAVELWGALRNQGFSGQLALVGPEPPWGSSHEAESKWLNEHPELAIDVVTLPSVTESEKAWLLSNTALVTYPTLSEGFGMVPFEAAVAGVPVLTTRQGSLDEVLPPELSTLTSLLPAEAVPLAERLLTDVGFRTEQIALLAAAADTFTWQRSAATLVDLLHRTLAAPNGRQGDLALRLGARPEGNVHVYIDAVVAARRTFPTLHRVLVGQGTRRQAQLRRAVDAFRRRLD